jgi:hypothetical protein
MDDVADVSEITAVVIFKFEVRSVRYILPQSSGTK